MDITNKLQICMQIFFIVLCFFFVLFCSTTVSLAKKNSDVFSMSDTTIVIKQVDYEGAIYYKPGDPYPHLDESKVKWNKYIDKKHRVVYLENRYIRVTILPEMGRVYSLVYKPTGHEEFWHNDIVRPGGGQLNPPGWWLWIGGVEYTLPGDEHGTTWATPWSYRIIENSEKRKTVSMKVQELVTKLEETIDISIYPDRSFYEAAIEITNRADTTVHYAHWVNPQMTPGGRNELTDSTEFIIPADKILIADRWQRNLGPSPQDWKTSKLRFISGWPDMGDLMTDSLKHGFYSAYSHDEQEGIVRVFDRKKNPGVDVWTYGFHTTQIPMGSGAPNKGYAEMWGGTSRLYPDERHPLKPGESIGWTEWMYAYQATKGLTYANKDVALNFKVNHKEKSALLGICPSISFDKVRCTVKSGKRKIYEKTIALAPDRPFHTDVDLRNLTSEELQNLEVFLLHNSKVIVKAPTESF